MVGSSSEDIRLTDRFEVKDLVASRIKSSQRPYGLRETLSVSTPGLNRVLGLKELVLYGIVLIQPTAPMPLYGVVCRASQGACRHDHPDRHGRHAVHGDQLRANRPGLSQRGVCLHLRRPGIAPCAWLPHRLGHDFRLYLEPDHLGDLVQQGCDELRPDRALRCLAVFFAVLFTLLNMRGIKASSRTNELITAGLGVVIVLFFGAAARTIRRARPRGGPLSASLL